MPTSQVMEKENGDDYIRRTASFVRTNERRLADAAISRRRTQRPQSSMSVLGWIGLGSTEQAKKPLVLTEDPHHLFYILMRLEALGIDVGSLDVRVQNPSRPTSMSYLAMLAMKDRSDVLSVSSFRSSMSSVSMFSLGGGWFGRSEPASVDAELKYLYSAFTKLPALRVRASGLKVITELAEDPPTDSAIPMDAFKNLQVLECHDIDPRTLMGWDRLSEGLRSLTVKRSGVEDVSDFFVDSVVDDKARREGNPTRVARPRLVHRPPSVRSRHPSFHVAQLPASVPEDNEQHGTRTNELEPARNLPSYAWSLLTHLSLADNSLTFLPLLPAFPSLSSLDLSSNLLVSVPPSLSTLLALKSLNLSHNMIDSVLGIYSQIPSILSLNLSANRLESLCGLERLDHLTRVDLRDNRVSDMDEVGRLAVLHGVKEIWVSGNPCTRRDQDWRVRCFDLFAREGLEVVLDGSPAGIMERRAMTYSLDKGGLVHAHGSNGRPLSTAHSPPVVAVGGSPKPPPTPSTSLPTEPHTPQSIATVKESPALSASHSLSSGRGQSLLAPVVAPKARRKKNKRIVDLDDKDSTDESSRETRPGHARHRSDVGVVRSRAHRQEPQTEQQYAESSAKHGRDVSHSISPVPGSATMSRATRGLTPSLTMDAVSSVNAPPADSPATISRITHRGAGASHTLSSTKSNKRRARISASVYEPAATAFPERGRERESPDGKPSPSDAELFRKRIEALRNEVGDSWLKVLSQTQLASPDESAVRRKG